VDTQYRQTTRAPGYRLTLGQEGVIAWRLVKTGGGLQGVQGTRMPVYRIRVNARRGRDAIGSTEDGRGRGGRGRRRGGGG